MPVVGGQIVFIALFCARTYQGGGGGGRCLLYYMIDYKHDGWDGMDSNSSSSPCPLFPPFPLLLLPTLIHPSILSSSIIDDDDDDDDGNVLYDIYRCWVCLVSGT